MYLEKVIFFLATALQTPRAGLLHRETSMSERMFHYKRIFIDNSTTPQEWRERNIEYHCHCHDIIICLVKSHSFNFSCFLQVTEKKLFFLSRVIIITTWRVEHYLAPFFFVFVVVSFESLYILLNFLLLCPSHCVRVLHAEIQEF